MPTQRGLRHADGQHVERAGDDLLIYNSADDTAHAVNHVAAAVFEACDGSRPIDDLVITVGEKVDTHVDEDVSDLALSDLAAAKLIILDGPAPEPPKSPDDRWSRSSASVPRRPPLCRWSNPSPPRHRRRPCHAVRPRIPNRRSNRLRARLRPRLPDQRRLRAPLRPRLPDQRRLRAPLWPRFPDQHRLRPRLPDQRRPRLPHLSRAVARTPPC